jgi:23S rRNA (uracil1939-C5)-methyltransferase
MEFEIEISRLGAQGDGVAEDPEGPIFVPFTLPGERVKVAVDPESDHARLVEILEPSRKRVAPVCPHFGECGGAPSSIWRPTPISAGSATRSWPR